MAEAQSRLLGSIDPDCLALRQFRQDFLPGRPPMARSAKAAKRYGNVNGAVAIHPKGPCPDRRRHAMRPAQIPRPDRAGQAKGRGIGKADGFLLIIEQ